MTRLVIGCSALVCMLACVAHAAPPVDASTINRISDAAFNHGQVVELAEYLDDRIGGRLTNSPALRTAERWTQDQFKSWGLKNVHLEPFDFGRGWWIEYCRVRMTEPRPLEIKAIPIAWTPGTQGAVTAAVVVAPMSSVKDFPEWKGKLSGKIVLVTLPVPEKDDGEAPFQRLSDGDIAKLDHYVEPVTDPDAIKRFSDRFTFGGKLDKFLAEEGAVAWVQMSRSEGRLVHGEGYEYQVGRTPKVPGFEFGAEDYRRLARLAKTSDVRVELDARVHYEDADHNANDVVAEISGSDAKAGFVMAGAHLDSWVAGDGAADNGAGSVVVMEAARILASLDVRPKRTLRFALWEGEEQGLLGSGAYVEHHFAHRPPSSNPDLLPYGPYFASDSYPIQMLPEASQLAGYFNIDNGSGKVRGIYTEGNFAVVPTFREWLAPFSSLGAASVVAEPTGGTDHVLMERLGLPGFQFIQDPLDYETRVHHTDLDTFDHLRGQDLRQAAVILATMMLDAAESPTPLPHNVVPTKPNVTDPFHYKDPAAR
jgi:carboxypeptidase Q